MLMIRLQRIGRKNDPSFRMVVVEKAAGPKTGKYIDLLGTYNPKTKLFAVQGEKVTSWVSKGAQLSPTLSNLLIEKGIITGKKINVLPKKSPIKKEGSQETEQPTQSIKEESVSQDQSAVNEEGAEVQPEEQKEPVPA